MLRGFCFISRLVCVILTIVLHYRGCLSSEVDSKHAYSRKLHPSISGAHLHLSNYLDRRKKAKKRSEIYESNLINQLSHADPCGTIGTINGCTCPYNRGVLNSEGHNRDVPPYLQCTSSFPLSFSLTFLGTSYFQVDEGLLIISGMCVFSTTSALFMFPAMYPYYTRALEVYKFEKADGVGKAYDLVIQGFVRFSFLALFPMIFAVTAIYLLVSFEPLFTCVYLYLSIYLVTLAVSPFPSPSLSRSPSSFSLLCMYSMFIVQNAS